MRLGELATSHGGLAKPINELEQKTEGPGHALVQLKQVLDALRGRMTPPDQPKPPIGIINPEDMGSKKTSGAKENFLSSKTKDVLRAAA